MMSKRALELGGGVRFITGVSNVCVRCGRSEGAWIFFIINNNNILSDIRKFREISLCIFEEPRKERKGADSIG